MLPAIKPPVDEINEDKTEKDKAAIDCRLRIVMINADGHECVSKNEYQGHKGIQLHGVNCAFVHIRSFLSQKEDGSS